MQIEQGPLMAAVEALLSANDLPITDLSDLQPCDFLYCGEREKPIAAIGLQIVGSVGLLRSLVVSHDGQHQGYGTALVAALESKASQAGIIDIFLLTETAQDFFAHLNYTSIPRNSAPSAIKNTAEFNGLCPSDATLMHKNLTVFNATN